MKRCTKQVKIEGQGAALCLYALLGYGEKFFFAQNSILILWNNFYFLGGRRFKGQLFVCTHFWGKGKNFFFAHNSFLILQNNFYFFWGGEEGPGAALCLYALLG